MQYVCSMYAVYMPNMCSKVTGMYAACMLYVCCMYAACMEHVHCMYAACQLYVCSMYTVYMLNIKITCMHAACIHCFKYTETKKG